MSEPGVKLTMGIALHEPADPETADRGDEHHEHLAERDRVVEFEQDGDRRDREAEKLAKPTNCCHRIVLRLGCTGRDRGVDIRVRW